jgi:hypothetical protein
MGQDTAPDNPLNVLVLYDAGAVFTNTVREHLESFARFSHHRVTFAPAAAGFPLPFSLDGFDAVVIHYSIRLAYDWHLSPEFAWALKTFRGLKAVFIQDEYDQTWRASQWITQLGVRLVFTCVPLEHVRTIYSKVDPTRTTFVPNLTGYLPNDPEAGPDVRSPAERRLVIGYRGRELPFRYGRLAREKLMIGVRMKEVCKARGIAHDIEWTEDKRIYGPAWVEFVASCRATLGTESGSNVFDYDGSLAAAVAAALKDNPRLTYEQVEDRFLRDREMDGVMNQVSPRIFEAVALRTGLVLFEGTYSGVVRPDEHFIPLKKDFSNVDDVLRRVQDDRELTAMTDRAYRDVIGSGRYTYAAFVREVDAALTRHAGPVRAGPAQPAAGLRTPEARSVPDSKDGWQAKVRRRPVLRYALLAARAAHIGLGLKALGMWLRRRRGTTALVAATPGLPEWLRDGPSAPGRREARRLALLRHACRECPTVWTPLWTVVRFDAPAGTLRFTSHPVHDMSGEIGSGRGEVDRAVAAVRARRVGAIEWEIPAAPPEVVVKLEKVGVVEFDLGPERVFRFTALARLADLDPERAARVLADVAAGASVHEAAPAPAYRRAS